jgi:hypothetical protein
MAATFNELLPTERDRLRLLLGDTNLAAPLYSDEAYDAELVAAGTMEGAGLTLARGLVAKYGQMPDSISISGEFSISWKARIAVWNELIAAWGGSAGATGLSSGFLSVAATRGAIYRPEYVSDERRQYAADEGNLL